MLPATMSLLSKNLSPARQYQMIFHHCNSSSLMHTANKVGMLCSLLVKMVMFVHLSSKLLRRRHGCWTSASVHPGCHQDCMIKTLPKAIYAARFFSNQSERLDPVHSSESTWTNLQQKGSAEVQRKCSVAKVGINVSFVTATRCTHHLIIPVI